MTERPGDPDVAYAAFHKHRETCSHCTPSAECAEGKRLLKVWVDAADYWAMATTNGEGTDAESSTR